MSPAEIAESEKSAMENERRQTKTYFHRNRPLPAPRLTPAIQSRRETQTELLSYMREAGSKYGSPDMSGADHEQLRLEERWTH